MPDIIVSRAIELLDLAKKALMERDISYNSNDINYEDYKVNGVESMFEDNLECFLRLWNSGKSDKAVDWVGYSALMASSTENGVPQSRFSPILNRFMPEIYKSMKKADSERT